MRLGICKHDSIYSSDKQCKAIIENQLHAYHE